MTEISARDFSLGFQSTIAVNKRGKIKIQQKHKKKEVARNCLLSSVFLFPKQFCGSSHSFPYNQSSKNSVLTHC